ncbi:MAG TPA: AAA family ATPase, partial [Burkholderiaceae bacterium]|nr:AAA family ATPase [Burkholderiaceae bacterium]
VFDDEELQRAVARRWAQRRADALARLADAAEAREQIATALRWAERLAADEPLQEHASRRLMRLHYRRGDRSAAVAAYEQLKDALDHALGETPSEETRRLAALIDAGDATLPVAQPPTPVSILRPPRLVGREAVLEAMLAARAEGHIAVLRGDAGMGKSRLLQELAATSSAVVLVAVGASDEHLPWASLTRLIAALLARRSGNVGAGASVAALPAWVGQEFARLLPDAPGEGVAAAAEPTAAQPVGSIQAARLMRAVEHLLSVVGPVTVCIDDLHRADEASLQLLPALCEVPGPDWVLALRPEPCPEALRLWWAQASPARLAFLDLPPLTLVQVQALLGSLDLPAALSEATWASVLHAHVQGHPMHLLETLQALLRSPARHGLAAGSGVALPVPAGLGRLVEERVAALTTAALRLARLAALAQEDLTVDLAAQVLACHPLDLVEALGELESQHVLHELRFVHDLVAQAVRRGVPEAIRRWLHRALGEALPQTPSPAQTARRAAHREAGGDAAQAARDFARAADLARGLGRLADECRWWAQAADLAIASAQTGWAGDLLERLVIVTRETGTPTQAAAVAERLLALADNDRHRAIAHKELGVCHMYASRFEPALQELAAAVELARSAGDEHQVQHATYLGIVAGAQIHGVRQAADRLEALRPWAEQLAEADLRHAWYADLAILLDQSDRRQRAGELFERVIAYFDLHQDGTNACDARTMFGRSRAVLGRLDEAEALLAASVQGRRELGGQGHGVDLLNLARVQCEQGRFGSALTTLGDNVLAVFDADTVTGASMRQAVARTYHHLGQPHRARRALPAIPDGAPFYQRALQAWLYALWAEGPAGRQLLLDQALACFESCDLPFARLPIEFDRLAWLDGEDALQRCQVLVPECEQREMPAVAQLGRLRWAEMLMRRDRLAQAREVLCQALDTLAEVRPIGVYLPEFHDLGLQLARRLDDAALAHRCVDEARHWILEHALPDVPEVFRDSFLHANPVNVRLLNPGLVTPR